MDEDQLKSIVKGRLQQDDFIEDDDGGGYADNGMEDWGEQGPDAAMEDDSEEERRGM